MGEASLAGRGRGVLGILDHFSDLLVGQDPRKIEHWWSELVRGTFWSAGQAIMSAVAGIDIALWDLKGKRLGVPVYDLLGGPTRERVRVYRHLAGSSAEELAEDALRWQDQGFTALRFGPLAAFDDHSLTHWDPQASIVQTIKATDVLRTAVGDDVDLILDAHTMFSPAEAAYLGADRERAGRLPAHRRGARRRHHGGEEDSRQRRAARAALRPPPRQLSDQRHGLPPRGPGGPELRHPGMDGARAALRALPERPSRTRRLRILPAPASAWSSTRRRRASARRKTPACRSATGPTAASGTTESTASATV